MSQPPREEPTGRGQEPPGGGWGAPPPPGWPQQPASQPAPGGASPGQPGQQPDQYGRHSGQQPDQFSPPPGPFGQPPGPFGQPPGQYGQQYGQYGPPGQQPPPGYHGGMPGQGGPQGPGGGRNNRTLAITIGAGVLLVAALAVLLVLTLGGDDDADTTADPTGTTAETSESGPTTPPATPSRTDSVTGPGEDLVGVLPTDFTDCTEAEPYGDGDIAAATCGASTTQPGPQVAEFYLFDDVGTLESVFAGDVADQQIGLMPEGQDCSTAQGVGEWEAQGSQGGEVACAIIGDQVVIGWTDRDALIEGIVRAPGSTQADLAALAEWWRNNSDYQI